MKIRVLLVLIILICLWILFGNQIIYIAESSKAVSACETFSSSVLLWRKEPDGRYSMANGIHVGNNSVLTVKHFAFANLSMKTVRGDGNQKIIRVIKHRNLDLAILVLDEPLEIPSVFLADNHSTPPYFLTRLSKPLFAGNNYDLVGYDSFGHSVLPDSMLMFYNGAAQEGDSGAALLDSKCNLVGLVTGGSKSFLWNLNRKSFYINLLRVETKRWLSDQNLY